MSSFLFDLKYLHPISRLIRVNTNPRQLLLLEEVRARKSATVEQLADTLGVTLQTVRRDVQRLADEGLLARFHGGVRVPSSTTENLAHQQRESLNAEGKQRIARQGLQVGIVKNTDWPAQLSPQVVVAGGPARCGHRRGLQGREKTGAQLGQAVRPVQHRQSLRGTVRGFQRGIGHVADCHALDKHPRFGGF